MRQIVYIKNIWYISLLRAWTSGIWLVFTYPVSRVLLATVQKPPILWTRQPMITITEAAREYLGELLNKQEDALGVRVFINQPGTPKAETCIAYCREGDKEADDVEEDFGHFKAWFQGRSVPFLEDAMVCDFYKSNEFELFRWKLVNNLHK